MKKKDSFKAYHNIPKPNHARLDTFSKNFITFITSIILIILMILFGFIVYKASGLFKKVSFFHFLIDDWNPGNKSYSTFGIGKIIISTVVLLLYALLISVPITIFSSIFISEYLSKRLKRTFMIIIQLLAGIPSVVFGLFAFDQIGSFTIRMGAKSSGNLTTAAITLAFMALPTMITLSVNAIEAVPDGYRWGSLALGVTKERTSVRIVFKSALPGIISAIVMGIARIVGETMAVILIAGNSTNGVVTNSGFSNFIFSSIRTLAGTIGLEMLENSGPEHEKALYAIGLFLFVLVIIINLIILFISADRSEKRAKRNKKLRAKSSLNSDTKYVYVFSKTQLKEIVNYNSERGFYKKIESLFIKFLLWISIIEIIFFISLILVSVFYKGIMGWQWKNFTQINGQKSGIASAFSVTILLVFLTIFISVPIALVVAIYLSEYAPQKSKFVQAIRFSINVLASTPSIVFGIFGLTMFINIFSMGMSILTGSLTMCFVVLPMLIINFENSLESVSKSNKIAAYGMGLRKISVIIRIVVPCAMKGLLTGLVLCISRIIGEAAPVYLTLGTVARAPINGFLSPGSTMTTMIYTLSTESSSNSAKGDAYQTSLVLVMLMLFINFFGDYLSRDVEYVANKKISLKLKILRFQKKHSFKMIGKASGSFILNSYKAIINKSKSLKIENIKSTTKKIKERNKKIKDIYKKAKRRR
ncbi:phosphate ABC transporter permease PstA [Spiroplasma endosymbiont of Aspidapion aeneum]|uniref:phosphate ABC transporter permease PstA n=1 Tax=Spiroplasma endosymbiont of Aspidapion aeneum TaxID=3066276 RepID=UPI00313ACFCA